MLRRFAVGSLTIALVLGMLFSAPLFGGKGGNGNGGGGKPGGEDPPSPDPPPFEYVLQILPMLDDGDPSTPPTGEVRAMNNHGDMVGRSDGVGVLWTDDVEGKKIVPLASLLPVGSEWLLNSPNKMNDAGQIIGVGYLLSDPGNGRPFRYTPADETGPAIVEDLSTIGIYRVEGINNLGHVVGYTIGSGVTAVVYTGTPGTLDADDLTVISPPENGSNMLPADINDLGQVTGSINIDGAKYAFRYTPPTGGLDAEFITFALSDDRRLTIRSDGLDINILGQVVGYSYVKGTLNYRPFLYTDDTGIDDLTGEKGIAEAINDEGDVTGFSINRGFVYLDGIGTFNLDDMVVGNVVDLAIWDAATHIYPAAISNPEGLSPSGEISGHIQASPDIPFLLTPQPLP